MTNKTKKAIYSFFVNVLGARNERYPSNPGLSRAKWLLRALLQVARNLFELGGKCEVAELKCLNWAEG
jgi:hypothetical protein